MNTNDFFKKLCVGVNFNVNKFRSDAERFKLAKKQPEDAAVSAHLDGAHSQSGKHAPSAGVKRKIDGDKALDQQLHVPKPSKRQRIRAKGTDVPALLETFEELATRYKISRVLLRNVKDLGYEAPTPVQRQAIPAMLERRELLCCAPTGSGKTAAFLIPIIAQLQKPSPVAKGKKDGNDQQKGGFRAVILAPTRELARQTYRECLQLIRDTGLHVYLLSSLSSARSRLPKAQRKLDILVCTPNRLLCLTDSGVVTLNRVEWLILDESDKLFENAGGARGFREQLAKVCQACSASPLMRRALFSATATDQVEAWCRLHLDAFLSLTVGIRNAAADLVDQKLQFVGSESGKLLAIRGLVKEGQLQPPVLVFVQSKQRAKELFAELVYDGINVDVIHAERTQAQRDRVVRAFRSGQVWVLICTEVLARGLDFQGVGLVINYDVPPSVVSYVHRIGRTGRAGHPGKAITFFTEDDVIEGRLKSIVHLLREAGQPLPDYLLGSNPKQRVRHQMVAEREPISTIPPDFKKKTRRAKKASSANTS
ncbi:probable ATP-dependent RNA helicase DDX52 isoform X1 [Dermacentor silvarum]|uniref:probable ATP-dependent RNA helicase DDX52 isoform X1 n=1 Tax=Dermacentor silvarum TaxID=543639 RepID=UPI0021007642|nr:probable ATP-dependent RNA helicase DDX52 isoform X1 [Dermacentor silvarum]